MDPASRRRFWDLINELSARRVTVFVTTHYLDEAEYCNDLRLIHAGRIVAGGSPSALKSEVIQNPILEVSSSRAVDALEALRQEPWVLETSIFGTSLHVSVADEAEGRRLILERLGRAGIVPERIDRIVPSLEDVSSTRSRSTPRTRKTGRRRRERLPIAFVGPVMRKEFRQIRRDSRSLIFMIVIPAFLLVMFGFALNFDVKNIPLAIVDQDGSRPSRGLSRNSGRPNISGSRPSRKGQPISTG